MVVSIVATLLIYAVSMAFLPEYFGQPRFQSNRRKMLTPRPQTYPLCYPPASPGRSRSSWRSALSHCTLLSSSVVESRPPRRASCCNLRTPRRSSASAHLYTCESFNYCIGTCQRHDDVRKVRIRRHCSIEHWGVDGAITNVKMQIKTTGRRWVDDSWER